MTDNKRKTAPCVICGKELTLPPWPIVLDSLECLDHKTPGIKSCTHGKS